LTPSAPACRDGIGQHLCSPACPEATRNHTACLCRNTNYSLAWTGP